MQIPNKHSLSISRWYQNTNLKPLIKWPLLSTIDLKTTAHPKPQKKNTTAALQVYPSLQDGKLLTGELLVLLRYLFTGRMRARSKKKPHRIEWLVRSIEKQLDLAFWGREAPWFPWSLGNPKCVFCHLVRVSPTWRDSVFCWGFSGVMSL